MYQLGNLPQTYHTLLYVLSPFILIAVLLSAVRIYTTWSYYQTLKQFVESPHAGKQYVEPPQIPYTLPWLANTRDFLAPLPGAYWEKLFSWHPRSTGICTLIIGGDKTHILFSPTAVQALFKSRTASREKFEHELYGKIFQMPPDQIHNAEAGKHHELEMNAQYLTRHERVNELTAHFTRVLEEVLVQDAQDVAKLQDIGLYDWIRDRMFTASTTALLGEEILKMYPDYCKDFYGFDRDFLSFFFQLPSFMMGEAIATRKRIFDNLEAWSKEMHTRSGGEPVDPEGPAWEPLFGSRLNRARQLDYKNRKLNTRTAAALDLGITFGLSSNVIPATGWMLMHILNPKGDQTLLPRVLQEVRRADKPDGSLDIPTLVSQPLLQSIWNETLRLYTDVLVRLNSLYLPICQANHISQPGHPQPPRRPNAPSRRRRQTTSHAPQRRQRLRAVLARRPRRRRLGGPQTVRRLRRRALPRERRQDGRRRLHDDRHGRQAVPLWRRQDHLSRAPVRQAGGHGRRRHDPATVRV